MGILTIDTTGSFPRRNRVFRAQGNGHAHAVAEAIAYLSTEVLPAAIESDHRLHDEGAKPDNGFDRPRV
jgi:hypothetical protein